MEIPNENTFFDDFDLENFFREDASLLEETRQSENEVPASEIEAEGNKARDMQIQLSGSKNIRESTVIAQSFQSTDTNSELDAASNAKRSKKRKIDRAYRERQKAIKQKQEEELKTLRQEKANWEAAKQKADKSKTKPADQKNDAKECRIEFELDFPDEVAQRKLMTIAAGFPGIKGIDMVEQGQRMILKGSNIDLFDLLPLTNQLKSICNTDLVLYEKKMDMEEILFAKMMVDEEFERPQEITYPRPQEPPQYPYAQDFAESYGATAMPHLSFKNLAAILLAILLLLLLIPTEVYSDVLIPLMNLFNFPIFFNAIGYGIKSAQKLICDIFDLLCN